MVKKLIDFRLKHPCLLAVLINVAAIVLGLLCHPMYETSDDPLMMIISADISSNSEELIFANIVLGWVLRGLTCVAPFINWYTISHFAMMFASFTLLTYIFLKGPSNRVCLLSVIAVFIIALELYTGIQFTKTSALAVIAGIIGVLYSVKKKRGLSALTVFSSLLAIYGSLLRIESLYLVLILGSAFFVYEVVCLLKNGEKKTAITVVVVSAITVVAILGLDFYQRNHYSKSSELDAFNGFNIERSRVVDVTNGVPAYTDYKDEYNALGLYEEDYNILNTWIYADTDVFPEDILHQIADFRPQRTPSAMISDLINIGLPFLLQRESFFYIVLVITCGVFLIYGNDRKILPMLLLTPIPAYAMMLYLDRYTQHRVALMLVVGPLFFLLYHMAEKGSIKSESPSNIKTLIVSLLSAFLAVEFILMLVINYNQNTVGFVHEQRRHTEISEIASDESRLYLIPAWEVYWAFYKDITFNPVEDNYLENVYSLTTWEVLSPRYNAILTSYGLGNPIKDSINNPDVVYIENIDDSRTEALLAYIRLHYDENAEAELIEQQGEFYTYRIVSR